MRSLKFIATLIADVSSPANFTAYSAHGSLFAKITSTSHTSCSKLYVHVTFVRLHQRALHSARNLYFKLPNIQHRFSILKLNYKYVTGLIFS